MSILSQLIPVGVTPTPPRFRPDAGAFSVLYDQARSAGLSPTEASVLASRILEVLQEQPPVSREQPPVSGPMNPFAGPMNPFAGPMYPFARRILEVLQEQPPVGGRIDPLRLPAGERRMHDRAWSAARTRGLSSADALDYADAVLRQYWAASSSDNPFINVQGMGTGPSSVDSMPPLVSPSFFPMPPADVGVGAMPPMPVPMTGGRPRVILRPRPQ